MTPTRRPGVVRNTCTILLVAALGASALVPTIKAASNVPRWLVTKKLPYEDAGTVLSSSSKTMFSKKSSKSSKASKRTKKGTTAPTIYSQQPAQDPVSAPNSPASSFQPSLAPVSIPTSAGAVAPNNSMPASPPSPNTLPTTWPTIGEKPSSPENNTEEPSSASQDSEADPTIPGSVLPTSSPMALDPGILSSVPTLAPSLFAPITSTTPVPTNSRINALVLRDNSWVCTADQPLLISQADLLEATSLDFVYQIWLENPLVPADEFIEILQSVEVALVMAVADRLLACGSLPLPNSPVVGVSKLPDDDEIGARYLLSCTSDDCRRIQGGLTLQTFGDWDDDAQAIAIQCEALAVLRNVEVATRIATTTPGVGGLLWESSSLASLCKAMETVEDSDGNEEAAADGVAGDLSRGGDNRVESNSTATTVLASMAAAILLIGAVVVVKRRIYGQEELLHHTDTPLAELDVHDATKEWEATAIAQPTATVAPRIPMAAASLLRGPILATGQDYLILADTHSLGESSGVESAEDDGFPHVDHNSSEDIPISANDSFPSGIPGEWASSDPEDQRNPYMLDMSQPHSDGQALSEDWATFPSTEMDNEVLGMGGTEEPVAIQFHDGDAHTVTLSEIESHEEAE